MMAEINRQVKETKKEGISWVFFSGRRPSTAAKRSISWLPPRPEKKEKEILLSLSRSATADGPSSQNQKRPQTQPPSFPFTYYSLFFTRRSRRRLKENPLPCLPEIFPAFLPKHLVLSRDGMTEGPLVRAEVTPSADVLQRDLPVPLPEQRVARLNIGGRVDFQNPLVHCVRLGFPTERRDLELPRNRRGKLVGVQPAARLGVLDPQHVSRLERLPSAARRKFVVIEFVAVGGGRRGRRRDEGGLDQPDASWVGGRGDGGHSHLAAAFASVRCGQC